MFVYVNISNELKPSIESTENTADLRIFQINVVTLASIFKLYI